MRNKYDHTGQAFALGKDAEERFVEIAKKRGWEVHPASAYANMVLGYDFYIVRNYDKRKIEVKSEKKISRQDKVTQGEYLWIEFSNINGDKGWVYKESDFVAFEHSGEFWLVPTKKLAERAESLVNDVWVDKPADALYNLYQRKDRDDILTLLKYEDIEDLVTEKWIDTTT